MTKRTKKELLTMPKPHNPAELELLTLWYFGKRLHASKLNVWMGRIEKENSFAHAQYEVLEPYASYHGTGWNFSSYDIVGYDYSRDFWRFVFGDLYCGGIANCSYGQTYVRSYRDSKRLKVFEEYLRRKQSGRLRKPYERLAHLLGVGENTAILDSSVLIAGRVDGAVTVSNAGTA